MQTKPVSARSLKIVSDSNDCTQPGASREFAANDTNAERQLICQGVSPTYLTRQLASTELEITGQRTKEFGAEA